MRHKYKLARPQIDKFYALSADYSIGIAKTGISKCAAQSLVKL